MAKLIGITGGIGSGKSIVARICQALGYTVYDCDARAKAIMDASEHIKTELCRIAGNDVVDRQRCIDRQKLAVRMFADKDVICQVNSLVHKCVREDIVQKASLLPEDDLLFVESAIMHTSMLDSMMQRIWLVEAPEELRVSRVVQRSGLDAEHIRKRMRSQQSEYDQLACPSVDLINNDNIHSLLLRVSVLIHELN